MPLADHLEYVPDAPEHQAGMVRPVQTGMNCPECGENMRGKDPVKHALQHWPARWDPNNPPSQEAVRRRKMLIGMNTSETSEAHWS